MPHWWEIVMTWIALLSGLCVMLGLMLVALDRLATKALKYYEIWPVVLKAIHRHVREKEAQEDR